MGDCVREFLGTCDCISMHGDVETIASYRIVSEAGVEILHRSKNIRPARWCPQAQGFYIEGDDACFVPTEPTLQLAG